MCTLEARKQAFKGSWAVGIPTIILCIAIFWFLPNYQGTEAVGFMSIAATSGMSSIITPIICGLISYAITKPMFVKKVKAKMANPDPNEAPAPEMGTLDEQIIFFKWVPQNWICYLIVFSVLGGLIFGFGFPAFLSTFVAGDFIAAGLGAKLFVVIVGAIAVGASAQFGCYLSKFYMIQMLKRDLPKLLKK